MSSGGNAADEPQQGEAVLPVVVVRISETFLAPLASADIHDRSAVDQAVLGRVARGQAETNGHVSLDLKDGDAESPLCFTVVFKGTTIATTRTHSGPAIVNAVATTQFTAIKGIEFNSDKVFQDSAARIVARTTTRAVSIQSTLPGVRGCLVRKVATRQFQQDLPRINSIATRNAERRIAASFDSQMKSRLDRLNSDLAKFKGGSGGSMQPPRGTQVFFCTTDKFLQICILDSTAKPSPPRLPDAGLDASLVQIWLHGSVLERADLPDSTELALAMALLNELRRTYSVVGIDFEWIEGVPALLAVADPWAVIGVGNQRLFSETLETTSPDALRSAASR